MVSRSRSGTTSFRNGPGLYQVKLTEQQNLLSVARNLAREECRTTAMSPDQLEQYGININKISSAADLEQAARQMRSVELEARQQWWRWLVLAGLVLIIVETALSAKAGRQWGTTDMNDKVQIKLWQLRRRIDRIRRSWSIAVLAAVILAVGFVLYATKYASLFGA